MHDFGFHMYMYITTIITLLTVANIPKQILIQLQYMIILTEKQTSSIFNTVVPLIRPLLPNAIPFIKPDFRCTEIVKYINKLSHRIAFSQQKVWPYKRGQLHYQKFHCL